MYLTTNIFYGVFASFLLGIIFIVLADSTDKPYWAPGEKPLLQTPETTHIWCVDDTVSDEDCTEWTDADGGVYTPYGDFNQLWKR